MKCPFDSTIKCYIPEMNRTCHLCKVFKEKKQTLLFVKGPAPERRGEEDDDS